MRCVPGYEGINLRWVCWALSQGLDPQTAGEVRRANPGKYELFTLYISREWAAFDARRGYARYHPYSPTDHELFDHELAASLGLTLTTCEYEVSE